MFGGKKLKDLTEEDIRRYAASLCSQSAYGPAPPPSEPPSHPDRPQGEAAASSEDGDEASAPSRSRKIAQAIAENAEAAEAEEDGPLSRSLALERVMAQDEREGREQAEEARRQKEEAERDALQAQLSEEERLRLEVLAELDRSQMPAVHKDDGVLLKTIEHYTFADSNSTATIYIDLDKDLFEGAAAHVAEANVEVTTNESDVTILLHKMPASKTVSALADWRLFLSPLFHSVEPDGTAWKIRKGKVSVRLQKKKPQEWRRVLKF
mmetsp:Transcript_123065/g.342756  ORF Transcript_123065/g.342756 Transcript_123065/m.342756 type:complete len:266 (+) Transcript_123065:67-864(+)